MVARDHVSPLARKCDIVVELFSGPMGTCRLGYVNSGMDAGRVVLLREVSPKNVRFLGRRLRKASEIAHSNLVKLLGTVEAEGRVQIASEYVAGVSLFELRAAAVEKHERLEPAVSARIVASALAAAKSAHGLCQAKGFELTRCIFADTVWVAEFGETLLTDVGLADLLGSGGGTTNLPAALVGTGAGSHDVFAAGVELCELLSGKPFHGVVPAFDANTPAPLSAIVNRALASDERRRFASVSEMAAAFSELPRELLAHEDKVAATVERLMKETLKLRRAKLGMLERALGTQDDGESTRCYSTASLRDVSKSDTVRPAAGSAHHQVAAVGLSFPEDLLREMGFDASEQHANRESFRQVVTDDEEDETRVMRAFSHTEGDPVVDDRLREAALPTIHVAEALASRRAVTISMRTPLLVGLDDPTLRSARRKPSKPSKPKRITPVLAVCVLTVLAAVVALTVLGPRRIGSLLRADSAAAHPR